MPCLRCRPAIERQNQSCVHLISISLSQTYRLRLELINSFKLSLYVVVYWLEASECLLEVGDYRLILENLLVMREIDLSSGRGMSEHALQYTRACSAHICLQVLDLLVCSPCIGMSLSECVQGRQCLYEQRRRDKASVSVLLWMLATLQAVLHPHPSADRGSMRFSPNRRRCCIKEVSSSTLSQ